MMGTRFNFVFQDPDEIPEVVLHRNWGKGRVTAPVNLTLSDLTEHNGKFYLRTIDISTQNGKDFPWGRANSFQWDVMEFVELVAN